MYELERYCKSGLHFGSFLLNRDTATSQLLEIRSAAYN